MFIMVCNKSVSLKRSVLSKFVVGVMLVCLLRHSNNYNKLGCFLVAYLQ